MSISFNNAIKKVESLNPVWTIVTPNYHRMDDQRLEFHTTVLEGEIDITISKGARGINNKAWASLDIRLNQTCLFKEEYRVASKRHWFYGVIDPKEYLKLIEFFRPFQETWEAEEKERREANVKARLLEE